MKRVTETTSRVFKQWFHKRNIIIVSEHKVKHLPISGGMQFLALMALAAGVCWASYSTGSYLVARSTVRAQSHTLRSIANARIDSNFTPIFQVAPASSTLPTASASTIAASLSEPMITPAALEQTKMFTRIAMLEQQLAKANNEKEAIIERMAEKTDDNIDQLEKLIKHTGLMPDELKKAASDDKPAKTHHAATTDSDADAGGEGGPYIPADTNAELSPQETALYASLDQLSVLRQIVSNLPISQPIYNVEQRGAFGRRFDPFNGHLAFHPGVDLAAPFGSHVYSTADGIVTLASYNGGYGNCIDVDHGSDIATRYGHLSTILVNVGQKVRRGDLIGLEGSTGRSTGPHLHYEVRYHDKPMNPNNFLDAGQYVSKEQ